MRRVEERVEVDLAVERVQVQQGAPGIERQPEELHRLHGGEMEVAERIVGDGNDRPVIEDTAVALAEDLQPRLEILVALARGEQLYEIRRAVEHSGPFRRCAGSGASESSPPNATD